jgi:hypothetical protein
MIAMTRTRTCVSLAIAALGATAACFGVPSADGSPDERAASAASEARLQRDHFAALRQPATAAPRMPAELSARFSDDTVASARGFETSHGTGWVLPDPARQAMCLAIPDKPDGYGITCQSTQSALAGNLAGS